MLIRVHLNIQILNQNWERRFFLPLINTFWKFNSLKSVASFCTQPNNKPYIFFSEKSILVNLLEHLKNSQYKSGQTLEFDTI